MTISREEEVESLLSKVIDLQKKVIEEQSKEIEWLTHEYDSAHGIMVKKNQALREALSDCIKKMKDIIEKSKRCGDCDYECLLQDCMKDYSISGVVKKALAALQEES